MLTIYPHIYLTKYFSSHTYVNLTFPLQFYPSNFLFILHILFIYFITTLFYHTFVYYLILFYYSLFSLYQLFSLAYLLTIVMYGFIIVVYEVFRNLFGILSFLLFIFIMCIFFFIRFAIGLIELSQHLVFKLALVIIVFQIHCL